MAPCESAEAVDPQWCVGASAPRQFAERARRAANCVLRFARWGTSRHQLGDDCPRLVVYADLHNMFGDGLW